MNKDKSLQHRANQRASKSREEWQRLWRKEYQRNRDLILKRMQTYQRNNLEKFRMYNAKHRSATLEGSLTESEWFHIILNQDLLCFYCGKFTPDLECEHKIPISRGGLHIASNVCGACSDCNKRKGTLTDIEYMRRVTADALAKSFNTQS